MAASNLPVSLIDEFLADYEPSNLGRPMTAEERALAEEVLFDFIVIDLPTEIPPQCAAALTDIWSLIESGAPHMAKAVDARLRMIERAARQMAIHMQRRERSFDIMREHLVMLSDRACKTGRRTD